MLSNEIAIKVENISKTYLMFHSPAARLLQFFRSTNKYEEFKALDSISFEVRKGESLGIVGKNGSGKSTLLQIIAGTVVPTSGNVYTNGKVVALLELGSGFNPEFTGRENVYLNAAMFGITQEEMEHKFTEIINFADIGDHLDQPVKTYSSGMFARLAFSVAVNVNPDILIVDEILAVGDIAFQAKCVSKLRRMKEEGLTLLFVSHSVDSVKSLCHTAILLHKGKLMDSGTSEKITNRYLALIREEMNRGVSDFEIDSWDTERHIESQEQTSAFKYGNGEVFFEKVELLNSNGEATKAYEFDQMAVLRCTIKTRSDEKNINLSFLVRDITGVDLFGTTMFDENMELLELAKGQSATVDFEFPILLRQGSYSISVAVNRVSSRDYSDVYLYEQIDGAAAFEVIRKLDRPVHYKVFYPVKISLKGK
jgi:ABC-type polysaccharide/polyol phosphate transport system ATPase subunit